VAFEKAGARWVILHADPPDHVTADGRRRLVLQAVENRDRFSEAVLEVPASLYTNHCIADYVEASGPGHQALREPDRRIARLLHCELP
jgi:hypothetical protein